MVKMDLIRLCHLSKDLQKEKEFTVLTMVGRTSQAKGMTGAKALWQYHTWQVPGMEQRPGGLRKMSLRNTIGQEVRGNNGQGTKGFAYTEGFGFYSK